MSSNIHVTSFETLHRLDAVLGIFSADLTDKIQSVARNMENQLSWIEERYQELEAELHRWESEYEQANQEDDDTGYLRYKLEEAEEKLRQARNLQRLTEEASENFARCARRVSEIADERINEAQQFLRQRIQELQDYSSVQIENNSHQLRSTEATSHLKSAETSEQNVGNLSLSETPVEELMKIPLPEGFRWIRLDEISQEEIDELSDKNQFRKVSYTEMENGLKKFESEILTVLKQSPDKATSDFFENLDIEKENDLQNGCKKIFNVFFGRQFPKFIKLERFAGESKYDINNGRHRIKVAMDLGWKVIPAEVKEVNWKRQ